MSFYTVYKLNSFFYINEVKYRRSSFTQIGVKIRRAAAVHERTEQLQLKQCGVWLIKAL